MDRETLLRLRRTVRRDEDISDGACRLFAEIADLSEMERGCIAQDKMLADYMNTTTRTVRRRRQELVQAGYLREERWGGNRHLLPNEPSHRDKPDNSVRSEPDQTGQSCPDRTNVSGQNCPSPDNSVRSEPDNSVRHREINITPVGAESESARPREGPAEVQIGSTDPVEIYKRVTGCSCPVYYRDRIEQTVAADAEAMALWEAVCMRWAEASQDPERRWDPRKVPNLLDAFQQERKQLKQSNAESADNFASDFERIAQAAGLA